MTRNYNRSNIYSFFELSEELQKDVMGNYYDNIEDAEQSMYVISEFQQEEEAIPLSMFIRTQKNKFTHGIFSDSYFSGYFITLNRYNDEAVISYKYF